MHRKYTQAQTNLVNVYNTFGIFMISYTYKCAHTYCTTHMHTYAYAQTAESTVGKRQEPSCSTKWKTRSSYLSNFLQGSAVEGHMCYERERDGGR